MSLNKRIVLPIVAGYYKSKCVANLQISVSFGKDLLLPMKSCKTYERILRPFNEGGVPLHQVHLFNFRFLK